MENMEGNMMDAACEKTLITVVFRDKIENHLNPTDAAVVLMLQNGLISSNDFQEIMAQLTVSGPTASIRVLLDKIEASQEQHIYRKFVDALTNSGNETCKILASDIQGLTSSSKSEENGAIFQKLIEIYSPDLMNITPAEIVPHLKNLSKADKERIVATCETKGDSIGALYLVLELSRCAGDSWYVDFLWALRQTGHGSLADKLEEGYRAKTDPSASLCQGKETLSPDEKELDKMEDVQSHEDAYESSGEEYDHNEGAVPDEADISMNLNSLDEEEKEGLRSPFDKTEQQTENTTVKVEDQRNIGEEKQEEEGTEKQHKPGSSACADNTPSQLYEDQLEVALPAIEGRNTMIIMPTGAGKTVVAASIIEKVVNDADDKAKCIVIFMVPTGPLVKQQAERLEQRLRPKRNFNITGVKGDTMKIPLKDVLEGHNVVVLTAAILLTALQEGDHLVELESLALLVFDECHHCMKDHVYNGIMKRYMYEKFEYPNTKLPQIVCLTATTGTGKAKSQVAAEDHVFQLCANLDVQHISVVEINQNTLQERISVPEQVNPICVEGRAEDPFKDEVCKIMIDIENIMKECPAASTLPQLRSIPRDKKSPAYMQWLSRVGKESGELIGDGDQLRIIRTCVEHLQDYHVALGINAEVRTKDAYDYLNTKYKAMSDPDQMEAFNDTDFDLLRKFMGKRRTFGEVSKNPKYHNPLLKTLEDIIVREFQQRPKSRALLFCQTVEATKALKTWIYETQSIQFLQPNRMVGGKDMTSAQHKEILDQFQEGKHKLLVATNVLEEGIDVAECNLVIRLNYVPSDTGHVQVKGRGRAKDSKSYLIASSDCNYAAWELANKARFDMSKRAVDSLRSMSPAEFHTLIIARQKEDYNMNKRMEQAAGAVRPIHSGEFQLLCGRCKKYACSTLDIGVYNSSHIVLCEEFLTERAKISPHPKPKKIDHEFSKIGKVHCNNCNHDWGILAIICQQTLPIIKISGFIIEREDDNGEKLRYIKDKWIEAKKIFHVNVLKREDLQTLKKMNIPDF